MYHNRNLFTTIVRLYPDKIDPMNPDEYVIGVDLGGTHVRAAAVSQGGALSTKVKQESQADRGYKAVVRNICSVINKVISRKKRPPAACGLGSAGAIDFSKMIVTRSPNFPDWENVALARNVGAGFDFPVILENDANAAALGEGWQGAAKGWANYAMLTLGTGIGGGVILNGQVWRGASGRAGEIGHITIHPGGRLCGCGNHGCLETTASASGVARTARERFHETNAIWLRKASRGDIDKVDAKLVARMARKGDTFCIGILKEAGRDIGAAIASVALLLGISRYVIGGGMAPAFEFIRPAARKTALIMGYTLKGARLKIVRAESGDDAGILGAAKVAIDSLN